MKHKSESEKALQELGKDVVKQIKKEKNPELTFTLRGLSNIIYDPKIRSLKLGSKTASRSFFNLAHAKKFLQTFDVAAVIKNLIKEGKHASLRDVFYQVKRT